MRPDVALVAPGNMGAGLARVLAEHGVAVRTHLEGRGPASLQRAREARMQDAPLAALVEVDFVLSVMPPAAALPFAQKLVPLIVSSSRRPVFVDCNAKSPQRALEMAALFEAAGIDFVDAAIIGPPPQPGRGVPRLYAAGGPAPALRVLGSHGLDVRVLEGPVGAAAALKMSFAGINKGLTAVASVMILAATRSQAAPALRQELLESWPALAQSLSRQVPGMLPKAYRWVDEMHEIAGFAGEDPAARQIFEGAAALYERLAKDLKEAGLESAALADFFREAASH